MATTEAWGIRAATTALHTYLHDKAEKDRFDNYEMRPWGSKAIQPGQTGLTVYAPTFTRTEDGTRANSTGVLSLRGLGVGGDGSTLERGAPTARKLTFGNDSATLDMFEDVFEVSKLFAASATLKGYLERAGQYLYQGVALTEEELIHEALFYDTWGTDLQEPSGNFIDFQADGTDATWGAYSTTVSAAGLLPTAIARIWKELSNKSNPGFAEAQGDYVVFLTPTQIYNMLTNVASNSLRFEQDSMDMTDGFKTSRVGRLFGCSLIQTTKAPKFSGLTYAANDAAFAAARDHEYVVGIAPDAYYCVEHETLGNNLYYEGFETGGVANPTHNYATLASSFASAVIDPTDRPNKMVVIPVDQ